MLKKVILFLLIIVNIILLSGSNKILFRDEFDNLYNWLNYCPPASKCEINNKIKKENDYSILKLETHASVTGVILNKRFNPYEYPIVRWRWKVDNIIKKGNAAKKSGDDFSLRIFILFEYKPKGNLSDFFYEFIKNKYGEYPPHSGLVFIWANCIHKEKYIKCPFTQIIRYIPLRYQEVGEWLDEEINIIDYYKLAFQENPPETATIAIMADTDNTGEDSSAYMDYIEIAKR